jgi:hypothetical protein
MKAENRKPKAEGETQQSPRRRLSALRVPLSALRSRRGISLLEVLISIGILMFGLTAVAMLIPIGKLAMVETNKSDRTGACGRAALHDLKVRNLLSTTAWTPSFAYVWNALVTPRSPNGHTYQCTAAGTSSLTTEPTWPTTGGTVSEAGGLTWQDIGMVYVVDPLGAWNGLAGINLGGGAFGPQRIRLAPITGAATADQVFRWQDDLVFVRPEEMTSGVIPVPPAGTRPVAPVVGANEGKFSWFLTVTPSAVQPGPYSVSVVVCNQRVFTQTGGVPDGERVAPAAGGTVTCVSPSYGGTTVTYFNATNGDIISGPPPIKRDAWVLLYSAIQCSWYRVLHAGYDASTTTSSINLVGPDWYGGTAANIIVVDGVTGVYTETVQLN